VFLFNILNYLSSGSQRVTTNVICIKDGSVAERLSSLIDSVVMTGAEDIVLKYKQKDLCALLGTQRTTLVSTLDKLTENGLIEYDSNTLRVLDRDEMIDLSR